MISVTPPHLTDSNILVRIAHRADPDNVLVRAALKKLRRQGATLCYASQNLAEFWSVCTRPATSRGGLGLSLAETERRVRLIERHYDLLPDDNVVHQEWRRMVVAYGVSGVQVYDAGLAAFMRVYGIPNILMLNAKDFSRYAVTPVHPANI